MLPESLEPGLTRYLKHHIPPGGFLLAVLRNDLWDACSRADFENRAHLFNIVFWLENNAPREAWGSTEKVRVWLSQRDISQS